MANSHDGILPLRHLALVDVPVRGGSIRYAMAVPVDRPVELPQDKAEVIRFGEIPVEFARHMQPLECYGGLRVPIGIFVLEDPPPVAVTWAHINHGEVIKWLKDQFRFEYETEAWSIVLPSEDGVGNKVIRVLNPNHFKVIMFNLEVNLKKYQEVSRATSTPIKIILNIGRTARSSPAAEAAPSVAASPAVPSPVPPPSAEEHTLPSAPPTATSADPAPYLDTIAPPDPAAPASVAELAGRVGPKTGDGAEEPIDLTGSSPEPMPDAPAGSKRKGPSTPWGMKKRRKQEEEEDEDEDIYGVSPPRRDILAEGMAGPADPKDILARWNEEEATRWTPRLKERAKASPPGSSGESRVAADRRVARLQGNALANPFERARSMLSNYNNPGYRPDNNGSAGSGTNEGGEDEHGNRREEDDGRDIDLDAPADAAKLSVSSFPQEKDYLIADCKALFKLPTISADKDIDVYGMLLPAHAWQVYTALFALKQPSETPSLCGALVADGVGMGKSVATFLITLVSSQLQTRYREVLRFWNDPTGKEVETWHIAKDAAPGEECRNLDNFHLQCPCKRGTIAQEIAKSTSDGPTVVIVPPNLVNNWGVEAKKFLKQKREDKYCLRVHVTAARDVKLTDPPTLDIKDIRDLATEPVLHEEPYGHRVKKEWRIRPKRGSSKFLFIAPNSTTLNTRFANLFKAPGFHEKDSEELQESATANWVPGKPKDWAVTFGKIIIDEFHLKKSWGTIPLKFAYDMGKQARAVSKQPLFVALTATPMDRGPKDIAGFIKLLEQPCWSETRKKTVDGEESIERHPLFCLTEGEVNRLQTSFSAAERELAKGIASEHTALDTYTANATKALCHLVIRRLKEDNFLGMPIAKGPKTPDIRIIIGTTITRYKAYVDTLANRTRTEVHNAHRQLLTQWANRGKIGPQPTLTNAFRKLNMSPSFNRLRIAATFPRVAEPAFDDLPLCWEELRAKIAEEEATPPAEGKKGIMERLSDVTHGSVKLKFLSEIIDIMLKDKSPCIVVGPGEDPYVMEKKMLVLCHNPMVALTIAIYLRETRPELGVDVLLSGELSKDQNEIIQDFQVYEKPGTPMMGSQILVSTYGRIGTGFNLVRASYGVFIDYPWAPSAETQAKGRIDREGQKNRIKLYRVCVLDNPAEALISSRSASRKQIAEEFWASPAMLVPSPKAG